MADKLMYIPNRFTQNYPIIRLKLVVERLDTQLNEPSNQDYIKVNLTKPTNKKLIKLFGTSVINNLMPPPSL